MTTKECEFDPDHLYHDHREADELRADLGSVNATLAACRAENTRLRAALEKIGGMRLGHSSWHVKAAQDALSDNPLEDLVDEQQHERDAADQQQH